MSQNQNNEVKLNKNKNNQNILQLFTLNHSLNKNQTQSKVMIGEKINL